MDFLLALFKNKIFLTFMAIFNLLIFGVGFVFESKDLMLISLCSCASFLLALQINSNTKDDNENKIED